MLSIVEVQKMNQSKQMTDGALFTGIFILLLLMARFIPAFIVIAIFLLPIPFVLYTFKYSWKPSLLMLAAAILFTLFFETSVTLPLTVLVGIAGILIGTAIHQGLSPYETWGRGAIGFIAGLLFVVLFIQLVLQINWLEEIDIMVNDSMEMSQEIMGQYGITDQTQAQELLKDQIELMQDLFPVVLALIAIVFAFLTQWVSYKLINRLENRQFRFPPFRSLRFPVVIIWVYFVALLFTFIDLDPNSVFYLAVINIFTLTGVLMTIQGLSFIFFYANYKKWSKAIPILSVVLTLLLPFLLLYFVRIIGIIDLGFGLRDRIAQRKK